MWKSFAVALILAVGLAGLPQQAVAAASYAQLMSALKNGPAEAEKFRGLMGNLTAGEFQVVNVDGITSSNQSAFEAALKKDAGQVADLRDTLSHTTLTNNDGIVELLSTMLKAQSVTIAQIVAVDVQGSQVTLFYR